MVSTKTQIAGFEFDNCLMNAAGVACMTIAELEGVKNSVAGTFVTKTATLDFRQGNPEPRYQDVPLGSINSMGLPNNGLDYYWIIFGFARKRAKPNFLLISSWYVSRGNPYYIEKSPRE